MNKVFVLGQTQPDQISADNQHQSSIWPLWGCVGLCNGILCMCVSLAWWRSWLKHTEDILCSGWHSSRLSFSLYSLTRIVSLRFLDEIFSTIWTEFSFWCWQKKYISRNNVPLNKPQTPLWTLSLDHFYSNKHSVFKAAFRRVSPYTFYRLLNLL